MSKKFGKLHILRTEHAISFYAMNIFSSPNTNYIAIAYDSITTCIIRI